MGLPPYAEVPWRTNAGIAPGQSVWICPGNPRRSNGNNLFHYCLNEHVNGIGTGNQVKITAVRQPTATVWLFDNGGLRQRGTCSSRAREQCPHQLAQPRHTVCLSRRPRFTVSQHGVLEFPDGQRHHEQSRTGLVSIKFLRRAMDAKEFHRSLARLHSYRF